MTIADTQAYNWRIVCLRTGFGTKSNRVDNSSCTLSPLLVKWPLCYVHFAELALCQHIPPDALQICFNNYSVDSVLVNFICLFNRQLVSTYEDRKY